MAAALKGISSMATRNMLQQLEQQWQHLRGVLVDIESVGGVDAAKRVAAGAEAFDVVFLASDAIDKLDAAGRIVAGSKTDLVSSHVAIAVAANAPVLAIDSEAALRDAVLAAPSIGYSTGPSGVALLALFERWQIKDRVASKLVQASPGIPVGQLVAQGDVALGFQQRSELIHVQGIQLLGDMPAEVAIVTTFSAACVQGSSQTTLARELLAFLRSPAAELTQRQEGFSPI
ncbi:ABC transporter substrate-binding protein [Lampropedia puyangensis]|uniref:ABC transporter substrate-binding protein n=1 Tax=Lampropedia puyangensis TaxID=1330072 RepID=A0A4S8ES53_9BURK|nr:substrate-binding domain-containing protein [Lampropedia puyangensis]THT97582.1 ABC transporter substrate-binding protein [Lampropedia puyangensis]